MAVTRNKKSDKEKFLDACRSQMKSYLNKKSMIIMYLRKSTGRGYGARPTEKEGQKIRDMLSASPSLTPEGYISLLEIGRKNKIDKEKREVFKKKFLTARSFWRARRTPPIGVVVAFVDNHQIHVGWSLCKKSSGDKFNRYIGVYEALRKDESGNYVSAYPIKNPEGTYNLISVENLVVRTKNALEAARTGPNPLVRNFMNGDYTIAHIPHTLLPHVEAMMARAEKQLSE